MLSSGADIAWLAGLLEGEGCFYLNRGRYPGIRLQMSDQDVVERAAVMLGGRARLQDPPSRQGRLPSWVVTKGGPDALAVMRLIRPYMGIRRGARIDELLEVFNA